MATAVKVEDGLNEDAHGCPLKSAKEAKKAIQPWTTIRLDRAGNGVSLIDWLVREMIPMGLGK